MTETNIIDSNKVFFLNRSDIEGRIDPNFYGNHFRENKIKLNRAKNKVVLFKEIINEFSGGPMGFHLHTYDYRDTGIPVLRIGNLKEMYLNKDDSFIFISQEKHVELKNSKIKVGDLIFSKAGKVGEISIVPEGFGEGNLNQALSRISLKNNVNVEYVYIFFKSAIGSLQIQRFGGGRAVQDDLKMSEIEHFKIVLPNIENQNIIVDYYKKAYFKKLQKESEAEKLRLSIDSYILSELGLKLPERNIDLASRIFTVNFSEVAGVRIDPDYTSKYEFIINQKAKYKFVAFKNLLEYAPQYGANEEATDINSPSDIRYIRITDIDENGNLKNGKWKTAANTDKRYLLNKDDLLFARSGSVGRCYIHKQTEQEAIFAGYLIRFVVNDKVIPDFIFHYCNSSVYKFWVSAIERPAVQSNINAEEYKSLPIPLPPIDKQKEMLLHIDNIHKQIKKLQIDASEVLETAKQEVERMILG